MKYKGLIVLWMMSLTLATACDKRTSLRAGMSVNLSSKVHVGLDDQGCLSFVRNDNLEPISSISVGDGCIRSVHRISKTLVIGESISRSSTRSRFVVIDLATGLLREAADLMEVDRIVKEHDKSIVVPQQAQWSTDSLFESFD